MRSIGRMMGALAAMLGLSAQYDLPVRTQPYRGTPHDPLGFKNDPSLGFKQHKDRQQPRDSDGQPIYPEGFDARGKIGHRNKVSSCARRANVMGKQLHGPTGNTYISYAQHDRYTREDLERRA